MSVASKKNARERRVLIDALYRGIFGRPVDPSGLATFDRDLADKGIEKGLPAMVKGLLASQEYRSRLAATAPAASGGPDLRRVIGEVYQAILSRPVDPTGLATFEAILRARGFEAGMLQMVKALFGSKEFIERMAGPALKMVGTPGQQPVNGEKVAHLVSLGTHCLVSALVKKFRLKRYSLPFDWLFSTPEIVLHCLDDDFAELLDPRHYVSCPKHPVSGDLNATHLFYHQMYSARNLFAHRDPTLEKDFLYYRRTVDRFRKIVASREAKLFVMLVRPIHDAAKTYPALSRKIRAMTPNGAFTCIQLRPATEVPGCHEVRQILADGNHTFYEFTPSSLEFGVSFQEPLDELILMRLLCRYEMNLAPALAADA